MAARTEAGKYRGMFQAARSGASPGHGRTAWPGLRERVEERDPPDEARACGSLREALRGGRRGTATTSVSRYAMAANHSECRIALTSPIYRDDRTLAVHLHLDLPAKETTVARGRGLLRRTGRRR